MFCPTCEAEYEPGITHCADDGAELVDRLTPEAGATDDSVLNGLPPEVFALIKKHAEEGHLNSIKALVRVYIERKEPLAVNRAWPWLMKAAQCGSNARWST